CRLLHPSTPPSFPTRRSSDLDQAIPLLPTGGLVRWLETREQLHRLLDTMGFAHHFLYASNGPSVGQWWLAHGAGGRLIAGAVKRSEEHTSELQSHLNLVCRLL